MMDSFRRYIDKALALQCELYDKELIDTNTVNLQSNPHHWKYPIIKNDRQKTLEDTEEIKAVRETITDIEVPWQSLYLTIDIKRHHHFDLSQIKDICFQHGFEFGHSFIFLNDTPYDIIHLKNKMVILLIETESKT